MKEIISTDNAPAAIGPYSQANMINGVLYISGQIPMDPATGKILDGIEKRNTSGNEKSASDSGCSRVNI